MTTKSLELISALVAPCEGNPPVWSPVGPPHNRSIMGTLTVFFDVSKKKKKKKRDSWVASNLRCRGWGLLSQFPPFRYIPNFSAKKATLYGSYWISRSYLTGLATAQLRRRLSNMWMWYKEANRYYGRIGNLAYGEINERGFSNPHPGTCEVTEIFYLTSQMWTNSHHVCDVKKNWIWITLCQM